MLSLAVLVLCATVLIPAVLLYAQDESRLNLPYLPNGGEPAQEPTAQPLPTETTVPTLPPATEPPATEPPPTLGPPPTQSPPCTPEQPPATYHLDDVSVSLERTVCFGFCPEYTVTIHGDGRVVYEGRRNVRVVGREEDQIDREKVELLLQAFYDAWFFDMRAEYLVNRILEFDPDGTVRLREATVTDLPSQIVTFRAGSYEKRVVDYYNPPPGLRELEAKIDETAGTAKWVAPPP